MGYGRQYAFHTTITVAATVLTGVLFYLLRIVFYQSLTPEQYGLFFSVYAFATLVQPLLTFGFDPGLVPFVTQYREEGDPAAIRNVVFGSLVPQGILSAVFVAVVIVLAPAVALPVFGTREAIALIWIMAPHAVFLMLFRTGQQFLLGQQALVWRNAADLVRSAVCLGAGYLLVRHGLGVRGAGLAFLMAALAAVATQVTATAVAFPSVLGWPTWRPGPVARVFESGKYLSVAFGGVAVFSALDTTVITLVRGNLREVAAYQIALPTVTIAYSLMTAAGLSFMPMARTLWLRGQRELLADGVVRMYDAAFAVMLPGGVLMAAFSDVLMRLLFGADILNAPEAFNLLAVGGVSYFISYLNLHILAGIGRARAAAVVVGIALGLDLVLDPVLIYFLGIRGAALASVAGYSTASWLGIRVIRAELNLPALRRPFAAAAAVSVVAWTAAHLVRSTEVFVREPVAVAVCTAAVLFLGALAVLEVAGCARLRDILKMVLPVPLSK